MTDQRWLLIASLRCWCAGSSLERNYWAWVGAAVQGLGLVCLALGCRQAFGPTGFSFSVLGFLLAAFLLTGIGTGAVCHGHHLPRRAHGPVAGAELLEVDGPADAPGGILVVIGGYGSESPAFQEPPPLRRPWEAVVTPAHPVVARFRKRVFIHPHGGFGWQHRPTAEIGTALNAWLRAPAQRALTAGRHNLLIAHSRGTQIAAATPAFREPGWRRLAVHPPAGVQPHLRLYAPLSPEIAEIHRLGRAHGQHYDFPWDTVFQATLWDNTVTRFPRRSGLPLCNSGGFGIHTTALACLSSVFWRTLAREYAAGCPPHPA